MIDADERSLQLPMFLAAQRSINTLIFRVEPLGKVSPVSQMVDCKNKNSPAFLLNSWILNRADSDRISRLRRSLHFNPHSVAHAKSLETKNVRLE